MMKKVEDWIKNGSNNIRLYYRHFLLFLLFLVLVLVIYGGDFWILANEAFQNQALSHLLILPFLVGFLFYLQKDVVKATLLVGRNSQRKSMK